MTRPGALRFDILLLAAVAAASLALPAGARGALAPPAGLAVTDAGSGSVRLVWSRSGPNAAQVTGYRVYRDGRFYKRARGLSLRVRASRLHTYRVAAADTAAGRARRAAS